MRLRLRRWQEADQLIGEVDVAPLQAKQFALAQSSRRREQNQRPFSDSQTIYSGLDFVWRQYIWRGFALRSLTHETNWIVIEELISAGMIEQHGHYAPDLRATALRQRQPAEPGPKLDRPHVTKFELSPGRNDPSAQVDRIAHLRGIAAPRVVSG